MRSSLLVAPTTAPERRAQIARLCDAFVYYLSVSGVTGERSELPADLPANIAALRTVTDAPICVGYGIATPAQVRQVAQVADGVIVGSALVRRITEHETAAPEKIAAEVESFVHDLAGGLS
jgi:tryptophan synthase alpha chain